MLMTAAKTAGVCCYSACLMVCLLCCRAGTLAIAGDLGGLQIANTGTGTVFTSGLASAAAAAVSGSGKTILIPTGGKTHYPP